MRRWINWLVLLGLLAVITPARPVLAQQEISLQSLTVDIWPEYDKPDALIIYRMTLSAQVKLPAEMTLRIPRSSGQPTAVAEQTENGLFNIQFTPAGQDGDWLLFKFTTTLPQLQVEFYQPITRTDNFRSFTFGWPGDYPVTDLIVQIQQPPTASNMQIEGYTAQSAQGNDGLTYHTISIGSVSGGQSIKLPFKYTKTDNSLTQPATFQQVTPAQANPSGGNNALNLTQVLPWALAVLGIGLIAGGVFWYMRGNRAPSAVQAAPRLRRRSSEPVASQADSAGEIFCHHCGKRASGGDVFCRSCGTRLRGKA